jgi:hypothetical protein
VGELQGTAGTVVEIVIPRVSLAEIGDIARREGSAFHSSPPIGTMLFARPGTRVT